MKSIRAFFVCAVVQAVAFVSGRLEAATNVVINTNDSGPGSLREAISSANTNPGLDVIEFNAAPQVVIETQSALPVISDPLQIRGFTQPGSSANTSSNGNNATIAVEVNGAQAGAGVDGFVFGPGSGGSILEGLGIRLFKRNGVVVSNALNVTVRAGYVLENGGNGIAALSGSVNVGGRNAADRQVVSGNGSNGVWLARLPVLGAAFATVEGSFIGTDTLGVIILGNKVDGVRIDDSDANVGELAPGAFNIISGNCSNGIHVTGFNGQVTARGNFIGTDVTCLLPIPNKCHGVLLEGGVLSRIDQNDIGFNLKNGITTAGSADFYRLDGNRVFGHVFCGLAVDIGDDGVTTSGVNAVSAPVITGVSTGVTTAIFGSYTGSPNSSVTIEVFANTECNHHGYGELETRIATAATTTGPSGTTTWLATMNGVPPTSILCGQATESSLALPPKTGEPGPCFDIDPIKTILTITQTVDPDPVEFNGQYTYRWDIGNVIRQITASNLLLGVIGPPGFTNIMTSGNGWLFSISNNTVWGSFGVLPPLTVPPPPFVVGEIPGKSGIFTNEAFIEADNARRVTVGGLVTVQPLRADLAVTKAASNSTVNLGELITYTISVTNNGPESVPRVSVAEMFAPGVLRDVSGSGWTCATNLSLFSFICERGPLLPGAVAPPLTVTIEAVFSGSLTNTVSVSGAEGPFPAPEIDDPNPDNDTAEAVVTVLDPGGIICSLQPSSATNVVNTAHTLTALITSNATPLVGVAVLIEILAGPHAPLTTNLVTDGAGQAEFIYTGTVLGTDTIQASGAGFNCLATKTWIAMPNQPPEAVCTNITRQADQSGTAPVAPQEVDGGSFDPDGTIADRVLTPPGPFPVGTNSVTLKVTDNVGAMDTCNATIIVTAAPMGDLVCSLSPALDTNIVNNVHTATAQVTRDLSPLSGVTVTFTILSGPNAGLTSNIVTDVAGMAFFSYIGAGGVGEDEIEATGNVAADEFRCTARKVWVPPTPEISLGKALVAPTDRVLVGSNVTYRLFVLNLIVPNSGVVVTDPVPAGTMFVPPAVPSRGDIVCTESNGVITCTIGNMVASENLTIDLTFQTTVTGEVCNTATVQADADIDPNNNSPEEPVCIPVVGPADLAWSKTVSAADARPDQELTYTIIVSNVAATAATGVVVTDLLPRQNAVGPVQVQVVSFTSTQGTCAMPTEDKIVCTIGDLAPGASATVTVVVKPLASAAGELCNAADVIADQIDVNPDNNQEFQVCTPLLRTDLAITKTGPSSASPGQRITYTVTVTNNGPDDATGVTMADLLPSNSRFISAQSTKGIPLLVGGAVVCDIGTLAALEETVTITIVVEPILATRTFCNLAAVLGETFDPNLQNNSSSSCAVVEKPQQGQTVLDINKFDLTDPVQVGSEFTYVIRVQNVGKDRATNVVVTDPLPAEVEFVSAETKQGTFTVNGGLLRWEIGTLTKKAEIRVRVRAVSTGAIGNIATVTSDQHQASDTESTEITETPKEVHDLAVVSVKVPKGVKLDPDSLVLGVRHRIVVTIQNRSPHGETIASLDGLVDLEILAMNIPGSTTDGEQCANIEPVLLGSNPSVPVTLAPKETMQVVFDALFNCPVRGLRDKKGEGINVDYKVIATVHHDAIDGNDDTHPEDDTCPRMTGSSLPEIDPNPDGTIEDKKTCREDVFIDVFNAKLR